MINGYSVEQIRAAEAPHRAAGEPLMSRAAAGLAAEVRTLLTAKDDGVYGSAVMVLVGSGDNGGDALFAAAELAAEGAQVAIVPTGDRMHTEALAAAQLSGCRTYSTTPLDAALLARLAESSDVIIDGIVGIGLSNDTALRGRAREVVEALQPVVLSPDAPLVVAVDIPSGIGADDGALPDLAVLRADVTVTFGGCKAGLLLRPASGVVGRIKVIDIGISGDLAAMTPTVQSPQL